MIKITREEVLKIARMSAINVHEDELDHIAQHLQSVISYAARVQEVATEVNIPSVKAINVFRADEPQPCIGEYVLSRAPESEAHYFVVPAIIEK